LSAPGNKRPGRVKGRKPKEVHAKVPIEQPFIENIRPDFSHSDIPPSGYMLSNICLKLEILSLFKGLLLCLNVILENILNRYTVSL
jgi:hypothetical protein